MTVGRATEYVWGTATNQNLTAYVNRWYFSDTSYQGCVFLFSSLEPNSYSFISCIIIDLAWNAEKGGGVLMSIILPNLNHSFICPVPDSGFRIPDSGFRIPDSGFLLFHTPFLIPSLNYVTFTRKTKKAKN